MQVLIIVDFKLILAIPFLWFKDFCIPKSLIQTFHTSFLFTNSLCEFSKREHKFKRWDYTQKPVWNGRLKDFWYRKKIWVKNIHYRLFPIQLLYFSFISFFKYLCSIGDCRLLFFKQCNYKSWLPFSSTRMAQATNFVSI